MRIEHIVVNASPIICLHKSGLLNLLPSLFSEIIIPDKVYQEIVVKGEIDLSSMEQFKQILQVRRNLKNYTGLV